MVLTWVLLVGLFVGCVLTVHEPAPFYTLLVLYIVLIVSGCLYGPSYIKADAENVVMGSPFRSSKIPVKDIESVELFQPTMGAIRIFASGGFMGYWGYFREGDIGKYYAFYGRSSDCFLIRLKDGSKYLLGCQNPDTMLTYIHSHLS